MSKKRRKNRKGRRRRIDFLAIFFILLVLAVFAAAAFAIYTKIISKKSEYYDAGYAYYQEGDYDNALDSFTAALAENQLFSTDTDTSIMLYIADIYMQTEQYDKAISQYAEILATTSADTDDVKKMKGIAQALYDFQNKSYVTAVTELETYAADYPELYLYIGTCYASFGDHDQMVANYEKYVEQYGWNSYIYTQYAAYYLSIDEYDLAYGYINNGLTSDSTFNAELRLQEITYYEKIYDYDKAYELAAKLVELYPEYEEGVNEYEFLYTRVSHEDEE